jgi:hypothetical protein
VKDLVHQHPRELGGRAIERNPAFAQKCASMDRPTAVAQTAVPLRTDRRARE